MSAGQWIALDADYFFSPLAHRLEERFGTAGLVIWPAFLCACKRAGRDGSLTFGSDADALHQMGLEGLDLIDRHGSKFDLDDLWRLLGQLKQTRRTRRGRLVNVTSTHWEHWQQERERELGRRRTARSRAINDRYATVTPSLHDRTDVTPDSDSDSDINHPPLVPPSQAPPETAEERGGGASKSVNGNSPPPVVAGAITLLAARRLDQALVAANAGRREPIHHPPSWAAAAAEDLAQHTVALAALAATQGVSDPAALADAWEARHTLSDPPRVDPPLVARCGTCAALTIDCACP